MSIVDFPNSPTEGQTFSSNQIIYIFQNGAWVRKSQSSSPVSYSVVSGKGSLISASAQSSEVDVPVSATNGHGLRVNTSTTSGLQWAAMPSVTALALDDIGDVSATSPSTNTPLAWNGSAWSPSSLYAGFLSITTQTGNYTIASSDIAGLLMVNSATTATITVPPNSSVSIDIGRYVHILQIGAGQVQLAAGAGVTLNGRTRLRAQFSMGTLLKRAADSWVFMGDTSA